MIVIAAALVIATIICIAEAVAMNRTAAHWRHSAKEWEKTALAWKEIAMVNRRAAERERALAVISDQLH